MIHRQATFIVRRKSDIRQCVQSNNMGSDQKRIDNIKGDFYIYDASRFLLMGIIGLENVQQIVDIYRMFWNCLGSRGTQPVCVAITKC